MKKLPFFLLAFTLVLTGAGCSGATDSGEGASSGGGDGVSIFSTGELVNDSLYNEYNGNTDGFMTYEFNEVEGTCSDNMLGSLTYEYQDASKYHVGMSDIQEDDALVALGTTANTMDWYFYGVDAGTVSCSFEIDGETFDVTCDQNSAELCSGTFTGTAL
ncbi:hypothetical protein HON52_04685 [Candidatus Uhrbacteria bacterium]|jgi:hypothetical protein|nr:hypothetical protein [Candidatus Uhrbacteria bacterium]